MILKGKKKILRRCRSFSGDVGKGSFRAEELEVQKPGSKETSRSSGRPVRLHLSTTGQRKPSLDRPRVHEPPKHSEK